MSWSKIFIVESNFCEIFKIDWNRYLVKKLIDFFLDFIGNSWWMFFFLTVLNIWISRYAIDGKYVVKWIFSLCHRKSLSIIPRSIENCFERRFYCLVQYIIDIHTTINWWLVYVYNVSYNKYPISKNNDLITVFIIIYLYRYSFTMYYVVSDNF